MDIHYEQKYIREYRWIIYIYLYTSPPPGSLDMSVFMLYTWSHTDVKSKPYSDDGIYRNLY